MDTARFDRLTKSLSLHVPRRRTLRLLSALAPLLGVTAMAIAPEESAADKGGGKGNGKGGNGGGKGNGKNNKKGGKKGGKKHHNKKKDDADEDILPPLCTVNQRPCTKKNTCVPGCPDNTYVFDESTCTCKCPAGKTECAVGCVDACKPSSGKVMDTQTCTCECPANTKECNDVCVPNTVGRDGEALALADCCSAGGACGGLLCCDVGQTCTVGSYNGQTRANCCVPSSSMLGPCDGVCCDTNPALTMCCPGLSNPCRAKVAGC